MAIHLIYGWLEPARAGAIPTDQLTTLTSKGRSQVGGPTSLASITPMPYHLNHLSNMCKSRYAVETALTHQDMDFSRCTAESGTKSLAADHLSTVSYQVGLFCIIHVSPTQNNSPKQHHELFVIFLKPLHTIFAE